MTDPIEIWRGTARLFWRDNAFGHKAAFLFVGGLCVGSILQWSGKDNPRHGDWRAWLMTDDDGKQIGWYRTEQEAKDALVDAAVKAITGDSVTLIGVWR